MALPDLSLYLVLDPVLCGGADGMVSTAVAAAQGGAGIIQLRAPDWKKRELAACGRALIRALAPYGVPLVVDDQVDVAMAIGAAGAHVGQKDLPAEDARRLMGPEAIIGLSVSNAAELEASRSLAAAGADGIAVVSAICGTADPRAASEALLAAFRSGLKK